MEDDLLTEKEIQEIEFFSAKDFTADMNFLDWQGYEEMMADLDKWE